MSQRVKITDQEALDFHAQGKPGKIEISPTKSLMTQDDLARAYSPGVAIPCLAIQKNPADAYLYTAKGNFVAVVSNGTAVLGLGNLGSLASKPVMEGKAVLFKRFADIDGIDIEVDTEDPETFINSVRYFGNTFGGINLEDIKAPECFIIENKLKELLDIPVFHDDQHGTAIITLAGMINALHLTNRTFQNTKIVVNGAGAAAIACIELIKDMGLPSENCILCDTKGVIYKGRGEHMNPWKERHAVDTPLRTLTEALKGADVFIGLSSKGAVNGDMIASMAKNPIVFAMANPDPEITPEEVAKVRSDAIVATGRSDYPNQVNNVLGFPYIFRGALDVHAKTINQAMKMAAAQAIADLARQDVPDEVAVAYAGRKLRFGPGYIIPVPFDPRLISHIPVAVAKAAMETGAARRGIDDLEVYARSLSARLDPTATLMHSVYSRIQANPKRIVFAEGEEPNVMRAALSFKANGYGTPILVESEEGRCLARAKAEGIDLDGITILTPQTFPKTEAMVQHLYRKLQRQGHLLRDCYRMVMRGRNVFASLLVTEGEADGLVSGVTRDYATTYNDIRRVIDVRPGGEVSGTMLIVHKGHLLFVADTSIHEMPSAAQLVKIAKQTADLAKNMGHTPRVAFLSYSNFGSPMRERGERIREAVKLMALEDVHFEYDGEMTADVALTKEGLKRYPFCRLTDTANVLIMPALHTAHVSSTLLQTLGDGTIIGPLLFGLQDSAQIVSIGASVSEIVTAAAFASLVCTQSKGA